jgi:hypothetical protein
MRIFSAVFNWTIYVIFFIFCPATLYFIFRRKLYRSLKFFTGYQLLLLSWSALWLWIATTPAYNSTTWLYIYWSVQLALAILRLLTIGEISNQVLRSYPAIRAFGSWLLAGTATALLLWTAKSAVNNAHHVRRFILLSDQRFEFMLAVLVVLLLIFSVYYRIPIPPLYRLILIGIGIYASIQVANTELAVHTPVIQNSFSDYLGRAQSTISVVIWAYAVWRWSSVPEAKPPLISQNAYDDLSPQIHDRLRELNDKLSELTGKRRR